MPQCFLSMPQFLFRHQPVSCVPFQWHWPEPCWQTFVAQLFHYALQESFLIFQVSFQFLQLFFYVNQVTQWYGIFCSTHHEGSSSFRLGFYLLDSWQVAEFGNYRTKAGYRIFSSYFKCQSFFLCNVLLQADGTDATDYFFHSFKLCNQLRCKACLLRASVSWCFRPADGRKCAATTPLWWTAWTDGAVSARFQRMLMSFT